MRICSALLGCCLVLIGCSSEDGALLGLGGSPMSAGTLLRSIPNPDPDPDDWFGGIPISGAFGVHSVYPSGSNFLVGSIRDDVGGLTNAGSFRLYDGYTGSLVASLPNPLPKSNAGYGFYALTIGNSIFTAGSDPADPAGSGCLFQFTTAGEFLRKIPNPAPQSGDNFGWPLTAVGPNLVVGATYDDPGGVADSGSVYLIDGVTGDLIAEIPNPEPKAFDWQGAFIRSVGPNFVVASRFDEPIGNLGSDVGRAYLFDGATGALITALSDPSPLSSEDFAWRGALDLGAGRFALATPSDFAANLVDRPGSVHLFDTSTGALDLTIANPGGMSYDRFGDHMATDGADRILVAAPYSAVLGTSGAGALHLFRASTGELVQTIPNPRPAAWDLFGYSASFVAGRIVVPTQSARSGGVENGGAVYVFDTSGILVATIDNPAPAEGIYFGYPLAVAGTSLAIGHSYDDVDGVAEYGRISIYDLDGSLLSSIPNPGSMPEGLFYSQSLTAVAGNFVVGSPFDTVAGVQSAGSLYLIAGPNDLPAAADDSFTTDEDTALVVGAPGVLANDVDADADPLTVTLTQPPASGTLALATDGSFTYTPGANFAGTDAFQYVTHDGSSESSPATVTLTVAAVDDLPIAFDVTATGAEDPLFYISVSPSYSDPDGCPNSCLTFTTVVTPPSNGTANGSIGVIEYRPNLNFSGTDSFTYRVNRGLSSSTATATVIVTPVNDLPVAAADSWTIAEDQVLSVPPAGVLANDSDVDGDTLYAVLACPIGGCVVSSGDPQDSFALSSDGAFLYTPPPEWSGTRTFQYRVNDFGGGQSPIVTVQFTITPVEDAPTPGDDLYSLTEDTPFMVVASAGVLANDSDPDSTSLVLSLVDDVTKGSLLLGTDGSFVYSPDPNESGDDTFTYSLSDGLSSSMATVTLTIVPTNDIAVAVADEFGATEDLPLVVSSTAGLLANDVDIDADALVTVLVQDVQDGTLVLGSDGSFVYTPDPEFSGTDGFTYHVNDGTADSGDVSVSIDVATVDDVPVAIADAYAIAEDGTLSIDGSQGVLANDSDVDSPQLTVTVSTGPEHGTLTLDPDGAVSYVPDTNYAGADFFEYVVTDGAGTSDPGSVSLTVDAVNDAPSAPVLIAPADAAVIAAFAIDFVWLAATDVESEPVSYRLEILREGSVAATFELTTLSSQVVGLDDGDYTWRVMATDGVATTASSDRTFEIDSESDGESSCSCSLRSQTRSGFSGWVASIPILAILVRRRRNRS